VTESRPPRFDAAYLDNPKPTYPVMARRLGLQGKVLVRVFVSAAGTPEKVELKETSGSKVLDRSALDAVTRWRFVPAREGDKPIPAWVVVPIVFTLKG
jgi:protein TonB